MSWKKAPPVKPHRELPWWHWSVIAGSQLERDLRQRQEPRRIIEPESARLEPASYED
jgi:hypothetical protein